MRQREPAFNISEPSIIVMIGVFILIHIVKFAAGDLEYFYSQFALFPMDASLPEVGPVRQALSLMSYGFLHADFNHLLMNSAGILIFGVITFRGVRAIIGPGRRGLIRFWLIFWAGVVIGGLAQWAHWAAVNTEFAIAVGASGGVSALFAAAGWAIGGRLRLFQFGLAWIALNIIMVYSMGNVAWAAHAGGFVAGALLAPYWVKPFGAGSTVFR